jgi:hypothetical protein
MISHFLAIAMYVFAIIIAVIDNMPLPLIAGR